MTATPHLATEEPRPDGARGAADEMTVDELAAAAGIPVRRIRFYAGKRLLPPPRLDGRTGLYGAGHLARLHLIAELQDAGYTLAAVEEFLAAVPDDADADDVALVGTLVSPAPTGPPMTLTRDELCDLLDREVSDAQVDTFVEAGLIERDGDRLCVRQPQLAFAQRLLAVDAPLDALIEAGEVVRVHARALAEDLQGVFERRILVTLESGGTTDREKAREVARALRPLTIHAIVSAYQESLEEVVRESRDR